MDAPHRSTLEIQRQNLRFVFFAVPLTLGVLGTATTAFSAFVLLLTTPAPTILDQTIALTMKTQNTNHETSLGHLRTLGHYLIMIVQGGDEVPFDVRQRRHISYSTTGRGLQELREKLVNTLNTVVPRARTTARSRLDQGKLAQDIAALRGEVRRFMSGASDANEGEVREIMDVPMPVFQTARLNAKKSACQSQLKQLGLATLQYSQDHNEQFPSSDSWCEAILPYVRNKALYVCPVFPESEYGYAMNSALSGVYQSRLSDPSRTPLYFDSNLGIGSASGGIDALCDPPRHLQFNNVVFADGHCAAIDLETAKTLLWSP